jgi:Flp pilus assembly protein TadG
MPISDKKGQTMVETALMLIFLMLIIMGIMEFGRAMYFKNTANNAARGVARVAVVTPNLAGPDLGANNNVDCSSGGTLTLGTLTITDFCSRFVPITKGLVTVKIHISQPDGSDRTGNAVTGDTVDVKVTVPFESLTNLITISPTLVGEASMRYE